MGCLFVFQRISLEFSNFLPLLLDWVLVFKMTASHYLKDESLLENEESFGYQGDLLKVFWKPKQILISQGVFKGLGSQGQLSMVEIKVLEFEGSSTASTAAFISF